MSLLAQQTQARLVAGMQAIVDSYDVAVGLTPGDTVWALNKARLYRYRPIVPPEDRYPIPLLLVYALINKPYILDLLPGRSFVEFMVSQGFDVYLLDWGAPGPEDRHTRFDDYAAEYLPRAVRKMLRVHTHSGLRRTRRVSGASEFSILGYCIGATISVLYAALHPDAPLRNLVLLTPPLDFSVREDSVFATWLDERYFDVDRLVDTLGNVPASIIEAGSKMLKPAENYVGAYATLWNRLGDEDAVRSWQAMHRWVHDGVPFAGEAFRQWVKEYIRGNELIEGRHVVRGQRADLPNIRAALLNVVAEYDHIVPRSQSLSIMDRVASTDRHLESVRAGHVGVMAGSRARHELWPRIAGWLGERSG
ncbi:MAG: alpha/beta fold hydrolase [Chloroflexi bacterium]|nr:alpha/beta fold hydrolase [Chloroflexota bacterium]MBU1747518.1 alpha/beta fold hydrolase [Chloroflexota bacterium]MBU1879756.1 alpha/beta fold hydrolase [Chloroflexota bacterium]